MRLLSSNWWTALVVGAAGMILPFGLGCAIAYGLYHEFRSETEQFPWALGFTCSSSVLLWPSQWVYSVLNSFSGPLPSNLESRVLFETLKGNAC